MNIPDTCVFKSRQKGMEDEYCTGLAADGYSHLIVGQTWVLCGALLSGGRAWPFDMPESSRRFIVMFYRGCGIAALSSASEIEGFVVSTGGDEV
ncbi:unnamed protein product [Pylaiella littoralis]